MMCSSHFVQIKVWTTFIDDYREELLRTGDSRDRGQRLLRYLGETVVNGSKIEGQEGRARPLKASQLFC